MNLLDFMMSLGAVTTELSRLLGLRFLPGRASNETPIGKTMANLIPLLNTGRSSVAELELLRIAFLVRNLQMMEKTHPFLIQHFRKEFRRAGSTDSYYGLRFEVAVAVDFIRGEVDFIKSEAPDFRIRGSDIGIECTSVRIRGASSKSDYGYKIQSAVKRKTKTNSHRPETALLIDATNVAYNSSPLDIDLLRKAATDATIASRFGAIVLFIYLYNRDLQRMESVYVRVDSSSIPRSLRVLMDRLYPFGEHEVFSYSIPKEA